MKIPHNDLVCILSDGSTPPVSVSFFADAIKVEKESVSLFFNDVFTTMTANIFEFVRKKGAYAGVISISDSEYAFRLRIGSAKYDIYQDFIIDETCCLDEICYKFDKNAGKAIVKLKIV